MSRADGRWLAGLTLLVALVLVRALGLRELEFSRPFSYESDGLQYLAVFRTILTTGWYTSTELLGAPFGATHYDAPVPDGLFLLFVSLLRVFTRDPAVAFNLLFIGGFLLVPACFFAAARMLGVPRPLAAAGALAYGFLPFHFQRLNHLFYTLYFLPPLVIAVAALLAERHVPALRAWLTWRKALLFIAAGAAGVYYAAFMLVVMVFAAVAGAVAWGERRRLLHGAVAAALIAGSTLANLAPSVVHQLRAGPNPEVAQRNVAESEVYGLKLVQMLLPNALHPIHAAGIPAQKYNSIAFVTENTTASLGALGAAGFLVALWWVLVRRSPAAERPGDERIDFLSRCGAVLFLVATVGGLGTLFALAVSPQLRALNRVSVVIAAIALLVLLLAVARWTQRGSTEPIRARRALVASAVMLVVWAVDEAPQRVLQSARDRQEHAADAEMVRAMKAVLPARAMVLQLPYTSYPEAPAHHLEGHYGLFRPYLHDSDFRWSYGDMRGRRSDLWLRALSARPVAEQVEEAARAGFQGILVERRAYKDNGAEVEAKLAAALGPPRLVRPDGKLSLYRIDAAGAPAK